MPETHFLQDVIIILSFAIILVLLLQKLKLSVVIGYLLAGVIIGPSFLGFIEQSKATEILAEMGVVFLLFAIGLELSFERLFSMRWYIFGLGLLQVLITSLIIGFGSYFLGLTPEVSLIIGGALSLSSTAVVLQILSQKKEISSRFGRISVSILLFQDLSVIPLLTIIPLLSGDDSNLVSALMLAGAKAVVALILILLSGRFLLRPFYNMIAMAKNNDVFIATTILVIVLTSWVTEQAGMSMALGAFLAGLMLSESEYRHQIEADIRPFKGILLGLFFITIGMSMDINILYSKATEVFFITSFLVFGKFLIITVICKLFRLYLTTSIKVAMLLAQGSEFAFVIIAEALRNGVISDNIAQIIILSVAISMIVTPFMSALSSLIYDKLNTKNNLDKPSMEKETDDLNDHIIVAGFGRIGKTICKLLDSYKIPYVVLENDINFVNEGRREHLPVYFADVSNPETLKSAGIERADTLVVAIDSTENSEKLVKEVAKKYPNLEIVARGHDNQHQENLKKLGATVVIPEALEPGLQIAAAVLRHLGMPAEDINKTLDKVRHESF